MRIQRGEAVLIFLATGLLLGFIATNVLTNVYYEENKADSCQKQIEDVSKNERVECYIEKDANEIGKTLVDKE